MNYCLPSPKILVAKYSLEDHLGLECGEQLPGLIARNSFHGDFCWSSSIQADRPRLDRAGVEAHEATQRTARAQPALAD